MLQMMLDVVFFYFIFLICSPHLFYKISVRKSAVSSTNLGSILIFAKAALLALVIYYVGELFHLMGGVLLFLF